MDLEKIWNIARTIAHFSKEEISEFKIAYRVEKDQYRLEQHLETLTREQRKELSSAIQQLLKETKDYEQKDSYQIPKKE